MPTSSQVLYLISVDSLNIVQSAAVLHRCTHVQLRVMCMIRSQLEHVLSLKFERHMHGVFATMPVGYSVDLLVHTQYTLRPVALLAGFYVPVD